MSQENVALVRSICSPWERGDFSSVEWAHPEIEYATIGGLTPGTWTGLGGMAEATRDLLSAWEDFRIEVDEYRQLGGDRVLVLWEFRGRGKASGLDTEPMHGTGAYLFHLRGGRAVGLAYYVDRNRAVADIEAAGLSE